MEIKRGGVIVNIEELYERINWKDAPSEETPINAQNLNKMDVGIKNNNMMLVDILTQNSEILTQLSSLTLEKVDGGFVENAYLYLTSNDQVVAGPLGPFASTGGGGGGGSNEAVLRLVNKSDWLSKTIGHGSPCPVYFEWSSIEGGLPTGNGVLKVIVNGAVKSSQNVPQGELSFDPSQYLAVGSNVVKVNITDVYGNSRTINYTINAVSVLLQSPFDYRVAYSGDVSFPYVPTGNITKNMHFILNGKEIGTEEVEVSGRQRTFNIPMQPHGTHLFEVYFDAEIDGETVESNRLYYDIMFKEDGNNNVLIACPFVQESAEQYSAVPFNFIVYNPASFTSVIKWYEGEKELKELTVDRTEQIWNYYPEQIGPVTIKAVSGNTVKEFSLNITESSIQIEGESEGLKLYLTSKGRSNNEENPDIWDWNDISAVFTDFNFVTDGWQMDEEGNSVLRVSENARLEVPYKIFETDFRTGGKTIEFEIATRDIRDYDAVILSCMSGGRGIEITAQMALFASEQSAISTKYKENEHIRISFVVEKRSGNKLLICYINGKISSLFLYSDDDDFSQLTPVNITIGSNDCATDIYNIRVYDNDLTRYQMLDNWIADTQDVALRTERYLRNNIYDDYGQITIGTLRKDVPYLVLNCPVLPSFKGDKKTCSGYYVDPVHPENSFTFEGATIDVQGTSSQYYYVKNLKIKFANGFALENGTKVDSYQLEGAVPTNTFTMKADVASSEGYLNVILAELYNELCPVTTPAQDADGRVRQTIAGHPMVIFHDNGDGPVFYGKFNFNHDKGTPEVFGFKTGDESWEILQNGTDRVSFKSADFSGTDWQNDFEARYPDGNKNPENLKDFVEWVASTDTDAATNNELETPKTYDGVEYTSDTKEYRLAKFVSELPSWAVVDDCVFYYMFTLLFLCIDQREKNAFPTFVKDMLKWIWLFYDADSSLGTDNKGKLTFEYWMEDIDFTQAGEPVFNGQNSVFWKNIRLGFWDKMVEQYKDLRTSLREDGRPMLSYEVVMDKILSHVNTWSEAIYNEDAYKKYIAPYVLEGDTSYLPMALGDKVEFMKYMVYNRFRYFDSMCETGTSMTNRILIRAHAKAPVTLKTLINMYGHVYFNAEVVEHRMFAGEEQEFIWSATGAEDAVIGINDSDLITSIGDLAPLQVETIDVSGSPQLEYLKLGDSAEGYVNNNLVTVGLGNNTLLSYIDSRNCPKLEGVIDASGCVGLEEAYFDGTSITRFKLPNGCGIQKLHLPATVTNISYKNLKNLVEFEVPSFSNVATLNLEGNSHVIDAHEILMAMPANSRVRIIGFDWTFANASEILAFYDFLDTMRGLDENENNVDEAQLSGIIRIDSLTGGELAQIKERYKNITIAYNSISSYLYYYNFDGSELLYTETIVDGGNGAYTGKPSRPSTAQYTYTFAGWSLTPNGSADSNATKNVEANRNVYAAYTATVRKYTVKFYNGTTLLQTVNNVPYGGSATYTGATPENNTTGNPDDFEFYGWNPSPTNIKGDTSCYAQFYDMREIADSWATIASNVANGTAESKYAVGAFKTLNIKEVDLPYVYAAMTAVIYNDEIHILGSSNNNSSYSQNHYKWNGTEWVFASTIPYNFTGGSAVVFNNEIHILGSGNNADHFKKHYKWNGTEWVSASTLPYEFYGGSAVVFNNEIHILASGNNADHYKKHYKWNGTEWVSASTLPYDFANGSAVVFNNEIHILGGYNGKTNHYKWNSSSWSYVSTLPYSFNNGSAIIYGNEIHILGGSKGKTNHYKWNSSSWSSVSVLPFEFYYGSSVTYNNQIHILGSLNASYNRNFLYFSSENSLWKKYAAESIPMQIVAHNHDELASGVKWESAGSLPYNFTESNAVVYNNEIHIMGGYATASRNYHYKWNGTKWFSVSTMPYRFYYGSVVVYNNEIHILGGSGGNTNHYKLNGTSWVSVSTLPYEFYYGSSVVYNNEIHILGGYNAYKHYKWDGSEWVSVSTLPFGLKWGSATVYNNEIHILGGDGYKTSHYKWNGTSWVSVSTLPYKFKAGYAIVYDGVIHILGSSENPYYKSWYKWDGNEWASVGILPFTSYSGAAVLYDETIHLLGGSGNTTSHIKLNTDHPKATLTFVAQNLLKDNRKFNENSLNTGGWPKSNIREYLNGEFIDSLPSDLQNAISEVNKISDSGSSSWSLKTSADKVWMLSANELGISGDPHIVDGQGNPYSVFTDQASRGRRRVDGSAGRYLARSTSKFGSTDSYLVSIYASGEYTVDSPGYNTYAVLIGFCI